MVRLVGHRQTKGTETDKLNLMLPRHISTLPSRDIRDWPLFGDKYDRMKFGNVLTEFKRRVGNAF